MYKYLIKQLEIADIKKEFLLKDSRKFKQSSKKKTDRK